MSKPVNLSDLRAKKAAKKESLAAKKWSRIKPKPMAVKGVRVGKTGRIRLTGKALEGLRLKCFERDDFKCKECGRGVTWDEGYARAWGQPIGEMAHIKSRGAGGSDILSNVRTLCPKCHRGEHNGGKPCPKREKLNCQGMA